LSQTFVFECAEQYIGAAGREGRKSRERMFPCRLPVVGFALPPFRLVSHLGQDQSALDRIQILRLHENVAAQEVEHENVGEVLASAPRSAKAAGKIVLDTANDRRLNPRIHNANYAMQLPSSIIHATAPAHT